MTLTITVDDDGYVQVAGISAGSLLGLMITDDIGDDVETCEEVQAGVQAVRDGSLPRYTRTSNATHLVVEPGGARLTWAMNVSVNTPSEHTLEELADALATLRAAIE
jgi:hypothetical protein